jgi:2-methylcitrate synthase
MRYKYRVSTIPTLSASFDWKAEAIQWPVATEVGRGLNGVIATTTQVMWLDPAGGGLAYRGEPVDTLAAHSSFEEVAYLLITGKKPGCDPAGYTVFRDQLHASRTLPAAVVSLVRDQTPDTHPTRLLRAGLSALGCHELSVDDDLSGDRHWRELRIVGQVAALVGEVAAHRVGRASPTFEPDTSLAESVLIALNGHFPDPEDTRVLNLLWVLYAAHGLDAPTFTSMVVASCLADPYFNVVAGLSALRGPRQGGASEAVLDQLAALDHPSEARQLVRRIIKDGRPIAGFGHRSYRKPDPRVAILRRELADLADRRGRPEIFERARAVEVAADAVLTPRGIHVNINFYAAPIFHLLGADAALGPCLFAVGRMAGLVALVREAMDTIRLVRPLSRYVGPAERPLPRTEPE